jgi:hypothetical protein
MKPALRIVSDTGEILDQHPDVQRLEDEIRGLQRSLASESRRYEELRRDRAAEAAAHQLWPKAFDVYRCWQQACNHPRATWPGKAGDRFWAIEPFLSKKEYGLIICLRGVAGHAYDHFSVKRKNGTIRHFDEWSRLFSTTDEFEERANRAPKGWQVDPIFASVIERWKEQPREASTHRNRPRSSDLPSGS